MWAEFVTLEESSLLPQQEALLEDRHVLVFTTRSRQISTLTDDVSVGICVNSDPRLSAQRLRC